MNISFAGLESATQLVIIANSIHLVLAIIGIVADAMNGYVIAIKNYATVVAIAIVLGIICIAIATWLTIAYLVVFVVYLFVIISMLW